MDIVARAQGILLKPKEEWVKIKEETLPVSQLFTSYVLILAAIPAIAQFVGLALVGRSGPYRALFRLGIGRAFVYAIFLYLGALVTVYLLGLIINALAPTFSSSKNISNAMNLAVYSMTPGWLAGVLYIIPFLGFLAVLGSLYGLYLLYLGFATPLMDTPKDKVVGYLVVSIIVAIVLIVVISIILGSIFFVSTFARI